MSIKIKMFDIYCWLYSYGGGTHPWSGEEQSTEDGMIEVVGLTTYQLVSKNSFVSFSKVYITLFKGGLTHRSTKVRLTQWLI